MGKICAVPGCQSGCYADRTKRKKLGLRQLTLFSIPKCNDRLRDWNRALGCDLSGSKFICQLHFSEADIKSSDKTLLPDGTVHELRRYNWYLASGAVPIAKPQYTLGEIPAEPDNIQSSVISVAAIPRNDRVGAELEIKADDEKKTAPMEIGTKITFASPSASNKEFDRNGMDKPDTPRNPFTVDTLKDRLSAALLPESWIRTNTDSIIPLHECATSFAVIRTYFQILKKIPTCSGTGYQHESRDPLCMGILDDSELYERQRAHTRCMLCRRLRDKLRKQDKRRGVDGAPNYDRTQKMVDLARRRCKVSVKIGRAVGTCDASS